MLQQLLIRNIVLIDRLDIRFPAGLSVLTGETGAGKSILLDAFALALGGRGDGSLVRTGEDQGQVTAVFAIAPDHPVRRIVDGAGLDLDDELILRRIQFADGRTRALANDQPIGVQLLREIGSGLVEIHGQHADRALVDPASHRGILDAYAGLGQDAQTVAAAARAFRDAKAALAAHRERQETVAKEAGFLDHAIAELTALAPVPGEEATLTERRQLMMQAEKVAQDFTDAIESVNSAVPAIASAMRRLERRGSQAEALVAAPAAALSAALNALGEAELALEDAVRAAEFEPVELERSEERLFRLRGLARKHHVAADDLAALAERFAVERAAIEAGEGETARLDAVVAATERTFVSAAEALSAARQRAAAKLDAAVKRELGPLKLERARFLTRIETDSASRDPAGFDRVEFWVETNPGTRPGPLMKVASGGELSRFILALKVVLADRGSAPTLVFDEIDTGVGGAVSDAIGQRLARLSSRVQVMAITHAPQVAARASSHFLIAKERVAKGRVATTISVLDREPRREEIARMLAGASVTDEARAAASRLIDAGQA